MPPSPALDEKDQKDGFNPREATKIAYAVYTILMLGMAAQFTFYTIVPGTVALICAIVYAYIQRRETKGTLFENHYRWMTRSFWIGGAVYLPIATILLVVYQSFMMDMSQVFQAMYDGEKDPAALIELLYSDNREMMFFSTLTVGAVFALWWWARCLKGLLYLRKGQPLPNVTSWL